MDNLVFLSASKDKLLEAIQYIHKKTPIYVSYKKTEAKKEDVPNVSPKTSNISNISKMYDMYDENVNDSPHSKYSSEDSDDDDDEYRDKWFMRGMPNRPTHVVEPIGTGIDDKGDTRLGRRHVQVQQTNLNKSQQSIEGKQRLWKKDIDEWSQSIPSLRPMLSSTKDRIFHLLGQWTHGFTDGLKATQRKRYLVAAILLAKDQIQPMLNTDVHDLLNHVGWTYHDWTRALHKTPLLFHALQSISAPFVPPDIILSPQEKEHVQQTMKRFASQLSDMPLSIQKAAAIIYLFRHSKKMTQKKVTQSFHISEILLRQALNRISNI